MLENISDKERELTKGMPDQVAIGFIKAKRKADDPVGTQGLMDFISEAFDQGRYGRT